MIPCNILMTVEKVVLYWFIWLTRSRGRIFPFPNFSADRTLNLKHKDWPPKFVSNLPCSHLCHRWIHSCWHKIRFLCIWHCHQLRVHSAHAIVLDGDGTWVCCERRCLWPFVLHPILPNEVQQGLQSFLQVIFKICVKTDLLGKNDARFKSPLRGNGADEWRKVVAEV